MEERNSKDRQRSASTCIIFNKKSRGTAGADYFVLLAGACPPIGIFDAGEVVTICNRVTGNYRRLKSPTAGAQFMEERNSKDRQRSASTCIIFNKKSRGTAGTDYFVFFTGACPPNGIFNAESDIAKGAIFAGMQSFEERDSDFRQLNRSSYFNESFLREFLE
ncbi:hypothetical protein [Ignatzschineria cameli]|uniref:hypothetical protein n=1 Tax=Ignatzschineria cameli TaxID=2182793 RepID=UPI000D60A026|nr:hypothetical protein [Ignatzschineria cameli]PWD87613.1 hypothetical protein DC080_02000 [Ignatzschineria cameli]